jgi:hypothetical protein
VVVTLALPVGKREDSKEALDDETNVTLDVTTEASVRLMAESIELLGLRGRAVVVTRTEAASIVRVATTLLLSTPRVFVEDLAVVSDEVIILSPSLTNSSFENPLMIRGMAEGRALAGTLVAEASEEASNEFEADTTDSG